MFFCAPFLFESLFSSYVLALNKLSYKKHVSKTLMKLSLGFHEMWLWKKQPRKWLTYFIYRLDTYFLNVFSNISRMKFDAKKKI